MDKPGFKLFTEEEEKKPVLSGGWVPIAIENKGEEPQPYNAKASRLDSLSSLNKDLKESITTVKSGWTPIVQKVTETVKPTFTSRTPPTGIKGLKDIYKEELVQSFTTQIKEQESLSIYIRYASPSSEG